MVLQKANIRKLYEITDTQYQWLEKIEEEYYKAKTIMIAIMHGIYRRSDIARNKNIVSEKKRQTR